MADTKSTIQGLDYSTKCAVYSSANGDTSRISTLVHLGLAEMKNHEIVLSALGASVARELDALELSEW